MEQSLDSLVLRRAATLGLLALTVGACDDDDPTTPEPTPVTFEVEIANVSTSFDLADAAVFNTPVGASTPGPLGTGGAYEASFVAGPGHYLHFATMLVQSNDLFYGPSADGVRLFDDSGMPTTGDITDEIVLWDAGTEIDQEPGAGADQAPRQSGPNTGAADATGTVRRDMNAFGNLPAVSDAITVTLEYLGANEFRLRIENIADDLTTSGGGMAPMLLAPGVVAVGGAGVLFTEGAADPGDGLEALAEDGDPSGLIASLMPRVGVTSPLAPGVWAVHPSGNPLFTVGAVASPGLEALAEDGDPSGLAAELSGAAGVTSSGVFNTPSGASTPGPLLPGSSYTFSVTATAGDRLSFATMLVQSNDLFYAPDPEGLALFSSSDAPVTGEITMELTLWDAGTETNERPGVGLTQAPRQPGPNTGMDEAGQVSAVNDGYDYPTSVLRVTITPTT